MNKILKFILVILCLFLLFFIHVFVAFVFDFPFSRINIIVATILLMTLWYESGWVVWFSFLIFLMMDLYSLIPFGVLLFSGTITSLFIFYSYKNIFTNRSWYSIMALSIVSIFIFRILYLFLALTVMSLLNQKMIFSQGTILNIFWEIILTSLLIGIIYIFLAKFSKKFNITTI